MKYHTLILSKLVQLLQNLLSAAVVIGALSVKAYVWFIHMRQCKIQGLANDNIVVNLQFSRTA